MNKIKAIMINRNEIKQLIKDKEEVCTHPDCTPKMCPRCFGSGRKLTKLSRKFKYGDDEFLRIQGDHAIFLITTSFAVNEKYKPEADGMYRYEIPSPIPIPLGRFRVNEEWADRTQNGKLFKDDRIIFRGEGFDDKNIDWQPSFTAPETRFILEVVDIGRVVKVGEDWRQNKIKAFLR